MALTRGTQAHKFDQIDVERINVVESDGRLRLVIANEKRSPERRMNDKTFGEPGGRPGLIFFNDEGDESGGLGVSGGTQNGKVNTGIILTLDQHSQDQVVALTYDEEADRRQMGLTVLDRPDVPLSDLILRRQAIQAMPDGAAKEQALKQWVDAQGGVAYGAPRLFAGRDPSKAAVVNLSDRFGRTRLRLAVDSTGTARVDFLDENGRVTYRLPNARLKAGWFNLPMRSVGPVVGVLRTTEPTDRIGKSNQAII